MIIKYIFPEENNSHKARYKRYNGSDGFRHYKHIDLAIIFIKYSYSCKVREAAKNIFFRGRGKGHFILKL